MSASAQPPDLPVGYYRDNFAHVLSFVHDRYADILPAEAMAFHDAFFGLDLAAQRMTVRLLLRRGAIIRSDKVAYPEIPEPERVYADLEAAGLLVINPPLNASDVVALLRKDELVAVLRAMGNDPRKSLKRPELAAMAVDVPGDALRDWARARFAILQPRGREALGIFLLAYFGNAWQDMSAFITSELGVIRYESYALDPALRAFGSRDELLAVAALSSHAWHAWESLSGWSVDDISAVFDAVLGIAAGHAEATVRGRADSLLNTLARQLERLAGNDAAALETALHRYEACAGPPARERRARILAKLGRAAESLDLCDAIADQPRSAAEAHFATSFGPRIARKLGLDRPTTKRFTPRRATIELSRDPDQTVESLAAAWLLEQGHVALHLENRLPGALFGLVLWDVIYAPVPGAFLNPYQRGPIDLFRPSFSDARRALIDARLCAVRDGSHGPNAWSRILAAKRGIANWLVAWESVDEELLEAVYERLGGAAIADVLRWMLGDLRTRRAGFPDLTVFAADGSLRFIEVKGPGDQLQPNQRPWLRALTDMGIDASVLDVRYIA